MTGKSFEVGFVQRERPSDAPREFIGDGVYGAVGPFQMALERPDVIVLYVGGKEYAVNVQEMAKKWLDVVTGQRVVVAPAIPDAPQPATQKEPGITHTPVVSSNLQSAGYKSGVMEVKFANGSVYRYAGVPEPLFREFMESSSKGKFFTERIKRGNFQFEKVA